MKRSDRSRKKSSADQAAVEAKLAGIERIERELTILLGRLASVRDQESRIFLKAEIEHLRRLKARLLSATSRRKPPEPGVVVPAVPPYGPLPKKGGATAPLDFD